MNLQTVYVKRGTETTEPWLSVFEQHTNKLFDLVVKTDAILLSKEDAEKIKETEKMLLKRIEWCDKKIELLMGALEANNIPEPMLNDLNK